MPSPAQDISASLEDYLEAIHVLNEQLGRSRVSDIAERLGVGKSAVTAALRHLAGHGLIDYTPYRPIVLTEAGRQLAIDIRRRHDVLKDFMTHVLGLEDDLADANACRMEHAIGRKLVDRLRQFARYIQDAPPAMQDWIEQFQPTGQKEPPDG
jgi:DtxR family Mn-dependent transcriptional regulator